MTDAKTAARERAVQQVLRELLGVETRMENPQSERLVTIAELQAVAQRAYDLGVKAGLS